MPQSAAERVAQPNLGQLLENTLHHGKDLLQAELSLARSELSRDVSSTVGSIGLLAVGALLLQVALITVAVELVIAYGVGVVAIVAVVALSSLGSIFLLIGVRGLERKKLPRTSARLALDVEQVMETAK